MHVSCHQEHSIWEIRVKTGEMKDGRRMLQTRWGRTGCRKESLPLEAVKRA